MLGVPGLFAGSGDAVAGGGGGGGDAAAPGSSSGGFSEDEKGKGGGGGDEGDRSFYSGNRWPRQETLALLKIRSDMDVVFRDSNHKGPLWEEVSRKLAETGYQRSAKKCKEKFENVYKYHKRTKEGRASKPDAKTYRFFDQLEALDNQPPPPFGLLPPPSKSVTAISTPLHLAHVIPLLNPTAVNNPAAVSAPIQPLNLSQPQIGVPPLHGSLVTQRSIPSSSRPVYSSDSSSSTSSDKEIRKKKKRKLKNFFDKLLKEVIDKQEELQRKFLEAMEKREQERIVREEAWKMQEIARLNREHEILVQERSIAAAKDAAVIAFLQKMTAGQQPPPPVNYPDKPPEPPPAENAIVVRTDDNIAATTSSRWPKAEVQTLIDLRTNLDTKYQETGPKGPLWEEISAGMRRLGYNRSSKRCKEKWENINKYFKKVKESNKKRPEDSKTCPYFQQLDELYKSRTEPVALLPPPPIVIRPEQQWPMIAPPSSAAEPPPEDVGSENAEHFDEDDDEEDDYAGDSYDIVTNKPS